MSTVKNIKIVKLASVVGGMPAIEFENHVAGTMKNVEEDKSLPIQYSIEGTLLQEILVGKSVWVARTKRNDISSNGLFQTSKVTEVTKNTFKTQNSIYLYKYI